MNKSNKFSKIQLESSKDSGKNNPSKVKLKSFSDLNLNKKALVLNQTGSTNSLHAFEPSVTKFESSSTLLHSIPAFSIPKEIRFKDINKKIKNDSIYTMPDTKSHRSTSIGLGLRPKIFKENGYPSANKYKIQSIFDTNIIQKKGYKFGGKLFYKPNDKVDQPGPQHYNVSSTLGWIKSSPTTLKFRHGFFHEDDLKYRGYDLSPNSYKPSPRITSSSRYSNISISFGVKPEKKNNIDSPGPGQYNLPSIFDKSRKFKYALN